MTKTLAITDRTHRRLVELKNERGIENVEALGNVLLILALSDSALVERAVNLIRDWDLDKGAERLEKENKL